MYPPEISDAEIDGLLEQINRRKTEPEDPIHLDQGRRNAIKGFADIQACPGSGKTTLVGLKLLLLSSQWHEPHSGLCVLTHSNVAKNEVIARLRWHPAGEKLLSYPHFIGTIQDFVNTFLALPYARSRGWDVRLLDAEEFGEMVAEQQWAKVHDRENNRKYYFSYYFLNKKISPAAFRFEHAHGKIDLSAEFAASVEKYVDISKSGNAADYFLKKREALCASGGFHYSEMYAFAKQAITDNPDLTSSLRTRFPVTILDEMQDTQQHQDDLINLIFSVDRNLIQKFGDPDQSIFDSMGDGRPNTSYNDAALGVISESHRFTPDIAAKITGLSYRGLVQTATSRPAPTNYPPNTIFLYGLASIGKVLPTFAALARRLPAECLGAVKAVGGIGRPAGEADLTLHSYWPDYDAKSHVAAFRPKTLCQAVRFCSELPFGDIAGSYQILRSSILDLMRKARRRHANRAGEMVYFSQSGLAKYLRDGEKHLLFGALLTAWIMLPFPTAEKWAEDMAELNDIIELGTLGAEASEFIAYGVTPLPGTNGRPPASMNIYRGVDGVEVGVATIHNVKGETHAATLVCETKYNRWFDLQEMLEFLYNPTAVRPHYDPEHPTTKASVRTTFMKRLYVAMSRPRFLLCLAMRKDHVSAEARERLTNVAGWHIVDLVE